MKKLSTHIQCLTLLLLFFISSWYSNSVNASVVYVNISATGANNGTSWINAFTSLSNALAVAADGDEIWVSRGIYKPSTLVDINSDGIAESREATFQVPSGVMLFGGFAGSEVSLNDRNWTLNPTVLSGDIDNNDVNTYGNGIAETTADMVGNNAYHVIYTVNVDTNTRVDGFIITAGNANAALPLGNLNRHGGGWYNRLNPPSYSSSPTIVNTTFQGNYAATRGGALHNKQSPAGAEIVSLIQGCKFLSNKSDSTAGAIFLGSFSTGNYQPHIRKCEFTGNSAYRSGGAITMIGDRAMIDSTVFTNNRVTVISPDGTTLPGSGGGLVLVGSNASFNGCIFESNRATGNPTGAFEGGGGGAVYMVTNESQTNAHGASEPRFVGCGFYNNVASDNTAAWGGAVVHLSDAGILRPRYINCVFNANSAQTNGGASASLTRVISGPGAFSPVLEPSFTNCTFTGNHANQRGGALYNSGYVYSGTQILTSTLVNSILWNNTAVSAGPEIFNSGNNTISFSLIQGSGGSGGSWNSSIGTDGGNNLDTDPSFVNISSPKGVDNIPANGDDGLRLSATSPVLNMGNNSAPGLTGISLDYIRNPRIIGSHVDFGAYERNGIIFPPLNIHWLIDWRVLRPCPRCPWPWAILLVGDDFRQFTWSTRGQLRDDGNTAIISGNVVSIKDKNVGFTVYLKLNNPNNWDSWSSKQRTYVALSPEIWKLAFVQHKVWKYWELSDESYLEGTGAITGKLAIKHQPSDYKTGFQLGIGANALDKDTGMYGAFSYNGTILYHGKKIRMKGLGSLNVDAIFCPDCDTSIAQKSILMADDFYDSDVLSQDEDFEIFPIPAKDYIEILSKTTLSAELLVNIYDVSGLLMKQERVSSEGGRYRLPLNNLKSGIYIMKLTLPDGNTVNKRLIIQ